MKQSKQTKRTLVLSVLSVIMCLAMLIGTTFAWFTDTASASVKDITSGKLDVVLEYRNGDKWESAEGKTLEFIKAADAADEELLWEPGCTYTLPQLRVRNNGNLALKYKLTITGIAGDAELNDVIDWTIQPGDAEYAADAEHKLTANGGTDELTLSGHMQETAGNEYMEKSITGITITVAATQDTVEFDSTTDKYDEDAGYPAYYTLAEFNALTELPEGVKEVYLNIGNLSLADGSVVIGNDNIRDKYERNITPEEPYGISYTNKDGINLIIDGGTIKDGPAVDNSAANKTAFRIPDKSTVTFKNVKIEGFFGLSGATSDNPYGSVMTHKIAGVTFDGCTFDALWLQNGSFGTSQITIKNSTFNKIENSAHASSTNPMWFKNIGQTGTSISIDNCVFNTNCPVKVVEEMVSGQTVSITNNTFNMQTNSEYRNAAIMFSVTSDGSTLGNVVVSGNKVNGGVSLLAFYNPARITMAEGATFTVSNNTLETGVKTSVVWKTNTDFTPDFVK